VPACGGTAKVEEGAPLRGIIAASLTPVTADGRTDLPRLLAHLRWLLQQGVHGLSLFGTTGEGNSLPVAERCAVLSAVVAAGIPASALMPAVGCCATADTVALLSHAVALGCRGILMMPPYYYRQVTAAGLVRAYAEAIERQDGGGLQLYLYNIPQLTGVVITESVVAALLRRYPQVIRGLKDSSGDWTYARAMLEAFPDMAVFTGVDGHLVPLLQAGGAGSISGVTNINPAGARRLFDHRGKEDVGNAARIAETIERYSGIPALKYLLAHYRRDPAWRRTLPPLEPLSDEEGRALVAEIQALGFVAPVFDGAPPADL
jgi:4-hydroxy-tetrahydrodipicolinate synthase